MVSQIFNQIFIFLYQIYQMYFRLKINDEFYFDSKLKILQKIPQEHKAEIEMPPTLE